MFPTVFAYPGKCAGCHMGLAATRSTLVSNDLMDEPEKGASALGLKTDSRAGELSNGVGVVAQIAPREGAAWAAAAHRPFPRTSLRSRSRR